MSRPSRRTLTMIAAAVVVVGGVLAGVVTLSGTGGSQSSPPGSSPGSTTLTTHPHRGGCDGLGICTSPGPTPAPCPTGPTDSKLVDAAGKPLQSWSTSCGTGKAVVAAYGRFIAAYNTLLDNPYGNGLTPWQELGHIYDEEVAGTLKATQIPKGCTIPAPSAHPISWPAPCDQLLAKSAKGDPLEPVATTLSGIATSAGITHMLHVLSGNLDAGYMTSGQLVTVGSPIVREIVNKGGTIFATAPAPASPVSSWTPGSLTVATPESAVVWACLADHLVTTNRAGAHGPTVAYWAMSMRLVKPGSAWLVGGWGVMGIPTAPSKGSPCGTAY